MDSFDQIEQLKQAIDTNDVARVRNLMTRNRSSTGPRLGITSTDH